jgi:hypothetical protein
VLQTAGQIQVKTSKIQTTEARMSFGINGCQKRTRQVIEKKVVRPDLNVNGLISKTWPDLAFWPVSKRAENRPLFGRFYADFGESHQVDDSKWFERRYCSDRAHRRRDELTPSKTRR